MHLVEDFDIKLHVENSIQPANLTITTLKYVTISFATTFAVAVFAAVANSHLFYRVAGELPKLQVHFSTVKYARIMALLNSLTAGTTTNAPTSSTSSSVSHLQSSNITAINCPILVNFVHFSQFQPFGYGIWVTLSNLPIFGFSWPKCRAIWPIFA